jgi:Na+-transporting methylmalonyl-CoA/oxaloacetate decarboxylase gamma subunit
MDNVTYGITMTVLGMGGTIVSLWIISLAMNILKRLFPSQSEKKEEENVGSH